MDSRIRGNDRLDSRIRGNDRLDSRLRGNDGLDSRIRGNDGPDPRLRGIGGARLCFRRVSRFEARVIRIGKWADDVPVADGVLGFAEPKRGPLGVVKLRMGPPEFFSFTFLGVLDFCIGDADPLPAQGGSPNRRRARWASALKLARGPCRCAHRRAW